MTTWVRLRSSTTTSSWTSPAFRLLALSAMSRPLSLLDGLLGPNAHTSGRHHQLPAHVAVLGDGLGEVELSSAPSFALPRLARLRLRNEDVARSHLAVVLVVLLGVEPGSTSASGA